MKKVVCRKNTNQLRYQFFGCRHLLMNFRSPLWPPLKKKKKKKKKLVLRVPIWRWKGIFVTKIELSIVARGGGLGERDEEEGGGRNTIKNR